MKALATLTLALAPLFAHADDFRDDRIEYVAANAADLATTAAALSLGAAEVNPLGVLIIPAKVVGYYRIKAMPLDEQQPAWDTYNAIMWGAAANNLCAVVTLLTGGASSLPCLILGSGVGWNDWKRAEAERERPWFKEQCTAARVENPAMQCTLNGETF